MYNWKFSHKIRYELDDETHENTDNGPPTIKTGSGFDGPTEDPLIKNGQLVHRLPIDQLLANIKKQPEAANLDVFVPINNALLFNNGDKDSFSVQHLRLFKRENGELATEAKTDVDHGKNISKVGFSNFYKNCPMNSIISVAFFIEEIILRFFT